MKKIISLVFILSFSAFVFAASYTNNTYQKLADEYTKKAQVAFDAGKYEDAVAYSQKAAENAELSKAYIDMMRTRGNAETQMKIAQNRISWAEGIKADKSFPIAFTAATSAYSNAESAFKNEDFSSALTFANASIAALDGIYEVTPLPEFYIVRPWAETKDCYWNISGRPYVYNNPYLWKKLYEAKKDAMENPDNPNIIKPGMKIKIPRLKGETRSGVYAPSQKYGTFGAR